MLCHYCCGYVFLYSSSSRMHVMNHHWSATKQHLHPQSVAEIGRHLVLPGDRIRQCGTSSGRLVHIMKELCQINYCSA